MPVTLLPATVRNLSERARPSLRPYVGLVALALVVAAVAGAIVGQFSAVLGAAIILAVAGTFAVAASDLIALAAIILTITLLPFASLPVHIALTPTFLDLLLLLVLIRLIARKINPRVPSVLGSPLHWLVLAWIAVAFVALLDASGRTPLTGDALHTFVKIILGVSLYFVVIDVVQTRRTARLLYAALCLGGVAEAIVGIALYMVQPFTANRLLNLLGVLNYPTGQVLRYRVDFTQAQRAIGTSVDPNVLGGLLLVVFILLLAQFVAREPIFSRWLTALLAAPVALCILLTYSRGAWVSLLVGLLFLGVWRYHKTMLASILVLLLFVQLPVSNRFTTQLYSGLEAKDQAAGMRLGEAKDAIRLIFTYPALGVGFGGSPDLNLYVGVSNIYLQMAEEMGVTGLAIFLATLAWFTLLVLAGLRSIRDGPTYDLVLALLAACLAVMCAGLLDRYFFSFQHDIALFWLLPGLCYATLRTGQAHVAEAVTQHAAPKAPALRTGKLVPARTHP